MAGRSIDGANSSSARLMSCSRQGCSGVWGGLVPSARVARPSVGQPCTSLPCAEWLCSVAETVEGARGEWSSAGLISWHRFRAQPTQTYSTAVESGNQHERHSPSFLLMSSPPLLSISAHHPPFYLSSLSCTFSHLHQTHYFLLNLKVVINFI